MLNHIRKLEADHRVFGYCEERERDAEYLETRNAILERIQSLRMDLDDLVELRRHACSWDDNDYCVICGADGRA